MIVDDSIFSAASLTAFDPTHSALDYRYRVRDGFHRYHIALACGFTCLPVALDPFAEEWM